MKKLLLVLILLVTAGSVFAADLKVTGSAMVRGTTWSAETETAGIKADKVQYSYFDYNFVFDAALVANEKATVFTKLTYDRNIIGSGYVLNGDNTQVLSEDGEYFTLDAAGNPSGSYASNKAAQGYLNVERMYINYKFHPALQLNTGLMGGGQWATTFGDNESNVMRVQAIGALSPEMIFIATYEKQDEMGAKLQDKEGEKDDTTFYYLSSILKFGPVAVKPLLAYGQKGVSTTQITGLYADGLPAKISALIAAGIPGVTNQATALSYIASKGTSTAIPGLTIDTVAAGAAGTKDYTVTAMSAQLGVNGDLGMVGFESEFIYKKADVDGIDKDHADLYAGIAKELGITLKTYGAYLNVFAKVDALKAGLIYVYGSADEKDGSFSNGGDFNPYVIMLDDIAASGFSIYSVYANYTVDALTVGAAVAYGKTNEDWAGANKDKAFMEYDVTASYAIDANTSYDLGFGYVQRKDWDIKTNDRTDWELQHAVTVKF